MDFFKLKKRVIQTFILSGETLNQICMIYHVSMDQKKEWRIKVVLRAKGVRPGTSKIYLIITLFYCPQMGNQSSEFNPSMYTPT